MKYVVAVVVVAVLLGLLRLARRRPPADRPSVDRPGPAREPVPMLRCAVCGVHLAASDAVRSGEAVYCCDEHRAEHERRGA